MQQDFFAQLRKAISHERLEAWYWRDLGQQHEEVIEVIGWINPAMKSFIFGFDRFAQVENRHLDDYQKRVGAIAIDNIGINYEG